MKGTYILLIRIERNIARKIGKLGKINFNKGYYVYVGSALNNLEKRIKRHLKKKGKKKHWHIDYLLEDKNVKINNVFYKLSNKREECKIARKIAKKGEGITGLGCSDCKCRSHLFRIRSDTMINLKQNFKNQN